jgi:zinc transport system ATP-binding protein
MALLTCQNASFGYEGKSACAQLNFEVNSGDYLCILGENGSGKTTLLKGLLRLIKPISGKVLTGEGLKRNDIGYLSQQKPGQSDFPASVHEIVLTGRLGTSFIRPFYSKADKLIAEDNMSLLSILDLKKKCYRELSGGQKQRVLLARALCAAKSILILDEPAQGLDPVIKNDLYQIAQKINCEKKITVIMVSHDIRRAVENSSLILHLRNKQLFFGNTVDYVKSSIGREFLEAVKLDMDNSFANESTFEKNA